MDGMAKGAGNKKMALFTNLIFSGIEYSTLCRVRNT
jgi:hypothetical protein